jgi:hypothetical protein
MLMARRIPPATRRHFQQHIVLVVLISPLNDEPDSLRLAAAAKQNRRAEDAGAPREAVT